MKKKAFAAIALTSCIAFGTAFAGCSLISTNNRLDMEQVIATVNISKSDKLNATEVEYAKSLSSTNIVKRELISYFLNVGYSYVQNGYSYEYTFNALVDALVSNAVLVQYSTVQLLKGADASTVAKFKAAETEVEQYEALLDGDEINLAKYNLYSSINSAIDNYEKNVIDDEDGYVGTETRTTPTNLNTEQDDYYPKKEDGLDYDIYTGYGRYTLDNSGAYKDDALDGTTRSTRVKAYNSFLNNLRRNNLVDGELEADNLTDVWKLKYIQSEYVSQLESRIINKYYDSYEDQKEDSLLKGEEGEGRYAFVENVYNEVFTAQQKNYGKSSSAFDSAMSSMSSSSFILYSPDADDSDWAVDYGDKFAKYGFIYNILLPFDSLQSIELSRLQSIKSATDDENYYFEQRNQLLKGIVTTDQRSAWFNGSTDYSFNAKDYDKKYYDGGKSYRTYLFFEDNLNDSEEGGRYKKLEAYAGSYTYNGQVIENEDESYTLIPNEISIDQMLAEFTSYVNYVLNPDDPNYNCITFEDGYNPSQPNEAFYLTENFKDSDDEIDYKLFTYAKGKVDFGEEKYSALNLMNPNSSYYKAMSAVNELQFAYTTDTGVLSNYIGYSVSAYDTNYIKEFEYAAKEAVGRGVGAFAVCAGDYGWHLIYVTHVFDVNEIYAERNWENIDVEGTFENLFYEWVKGNNLTDISSTLRTKILNDYNKDTTVTKYKSRYQDLLDLGK